MINSGFIKESAKAAKQFVSANSPAILTGLGIVGFGTAVIFGIRSTPKAILLIENKADEIEPDEEPHNIQESLEILTKREIVSTAWKCYIPTAGMVALSTVCIIGAYRISKGRNLALAGAYALAEKTLDKYQEEVISLIGEEKNEKIITKAKTESQEDSDISAGRGYGVYLCYDELSGRYFRSNENDILAAVNEFNNRLNTDYYLDVNEWYLYLSIPEITLGEFAGWNADRMLDISVRGGHKTNSGEPCLHIVYNVPPRADYRR